jgi:diguanylate cyclase (GGDEF)-like protein
VAFELGASALVVAIDPTEDPQAAWLAAVERAGRQPPVTVAVAFGGEAAASSPSTAAWLAAGFDELLDDSMDTAVAAARIAARIQSQVLRMSRTVRDPLTGLPTQTAFFSRLDPMLRLSSRAAMPMAVAVLDMDGFVALQADQGREVVRTLLVDISHHLHGALRRSDTVARLGDDRFGLILHHINGLEARKLLLKIWRSFSLEPATLELLRGAALHPTFTAGIAVFPDDGSDGLELYTRAEMALDVARATGQRRIALFSEISGDSGADVAASDVRLNRRGQREDPQ